MKINNIKYLYIYKSFIFRFVTFTTDNDDLKDIVECLNIKNRKKRITYIYDKACELIDNYNCGKDTCGFKNNQCYVQRILNNDKYNGCCRICLFQSDKGCKTKNLTCKLFNCSEVRKRYKMLEYKELKILKLLSLRQRCIIKHDYFSSREDVLKDLYSYSLIYSVTRMTIRMIYRYIRYRKL